MNFWYVTNSVRSCNICPLTVRHHGMQQSKDNPGRLKKFFGFSAKYEAQNVFFIHSFISQFRLQRCALGARDFQTPLDDHISTSHISGYGGLIKKKTSWYNTLLYLFFSGGLRPGDVITQINGNEIASSSDIYRLVEEQSELKVTVKRGSDTVKLTVIAEEVNWVIDGKTVVSPVH